MLFVSIISPFFIDFVTCCFILRDNGTMGHLFSKTHVRAGVYFRFQCPICPVVPSGDVGFCFFPFDATMH